MQATKPSNIRRLVQLALALGVAGAASSAFAAPSDLQAHTVWHNLVHTMAASKAGCFHATYPSTVWVPSQCGAPAHRYLMPPARSSNGHLQNVGSGNDVVLTSATQITQITGSFPQVTNVNRERGVGVVAYGGSGILGPNEYTLQINSQFNETTAACNGAANCTIWQQFVYAPDYAVQGSAAVFIEYWLFNYGGACPTGWETAGPGECVVNSEYVQAPDVPITQLGSESLTGAVVAGGNDTITFSVGETAYTLNVPDSVLDLATAWNQAEFNVVGNAGGSRAVFNPHASMTVEIAAVNGATAAPTCTPMSGTTGETNNLNLKSCAAYPGTANSSPNIQFTQSN